MGGGGKEGLVWGRSFGLTREDASGGDVKSVNQRLDDQGPKRTVCNERGRECDGFSFLFIRQPVDKGEIECVRAQQCCNNRGKIKDAVLIFDF